MENINLTMELEKAKEELNQVKLQFMETQYQADQLRLQAEQQVKALQSEVLVKASVVNFLEEKLKGEEESEKVRDIQKK